MRVQATSVVTLTLSLNPVDCASCGVVFGMTQELQLRRRTDGGDFFCPNGHANVYKGGTLDQLRKEAIRAKANADQWAAALEGERRTRQDIERSLAATRGQITKLRKRAQAGVCPCCTRHFVHLHRHMKSKHPEAIIPGETSD